MTGLTGVALPEPKRTPILQDGPILLKSESTQWTGSAKYRMVRSKVVAALKSGDIASGTTLVEVTSGSTGVALAFAGRHLGVPVELHAYETISAAKRNTMQQSGAKVVCHPTSTPVSKILEIVRAQSESAGYWHLDQYDRQSTVSAYQDLAREIVRQIQQLGAPPPEIFLCPVGTGGLIQGIGCLLREEFPGIRVIALEPEAGATIDGIRNTSLFHLGSQDPYDPLFPDEVIRVPPPKGTMKVSDVILGESSTAAYLLAGQRQWSRVLILAPD